MSVTNAGAVVPVSVKGCPGADSSTINISLNHETLQGLQIEIVGDSRITQRAYDCAAGEAHAELADTGDPDPNQWIDRQYKDDVGQAHCTLNIASANGGRLKGGFDSKLCRVKLDGNTYDCRDVTASFDLPY